MTGPILGAVVILPGAGKASAVIAEDGERITRKY
jgi:hypothetical protein